MQLVLLVDTWNIQQSYSLLLPRELCGICKVTVSLGCSIEMKEVQIYLASQIVTMMGIQMTEEVLPDMSLC